jgi:hypothetical protein
MPIGEGEQGTTILVEIYTDIIEWTGAILE